MDHLRAYGDSDEDSGSEQQYVEDEVVLQIPSPSAEEPPRRPSYEKSDSSGDEDMVDAAIKDGMESLKAEEMLADREPFTPLSNVDSGGDGTPGLGSHKAEVPPSPPGECDPTVKEVFEKHFEKKASGFRINESIKCHKSFKNPAIYEFLVQNYKIDEKGTNFSENIFDPKRFKKEDFYDHFREMDRQASEKMEKQKKEQERILAEATAAVAAAAKKQKSRFNDAK